MGGQPAGQKNGWMFGLPASGEQVLLYLLQAGNEWSTAGLYPRTCLVLSDLEEATEGLLLNFADDSKFGGNHLLRWR